MAIKESSEPVYVSDNAVVHSIENYSAPWPFYLAAYLIRRPDGIILGFAVSLEDAIRWAEARSVNASTDSANKTMVCNECDRTLMLCQCDRNSA